MNGQETPAQTRDYDRIYSVDGEPFNGGAPDPLIENVVALKGSGCALDVGAGTGRNSLFLAANGFDVTAVDISSVGIERLKAKATMKGLSIRAEREDIRLIRLSDSFDVVVVVLMLHHLKKDEARDVIRSLQRCSSHDGLHALAVFTSDSDFCSNDSGQTHFYPTVGELNELYSGWTVLRTGLNRGPAYCRRSDGEQFVNTVAHLLLLKSNLLGGVVG